MKMLSNFEIGEIFWESAAGKRECSPKLDVRNVGKEPCDLGCRTQFLLKVHY